MAMLFNSFLCCLAFQSVFSQIIIFSTGGGDCNFLCDDNMKTAMAQHCKRGCRFADLIGASQNLELNQTSTRDLCYDSCKEAYEKSGVDVINACMKGCDNSATSTSDEHVEGLAAIRKIMEEDIKRFDLLSGLMFSQMFKHLPFFSHDSAEEADESREEMIPYLNDALNKPNPKDIFDVELEVDVINPDDQDLVSFRNQAKPSFIPRRYSFVTGSLTGLLAASFLVLFVFSGCVLTSIYCIKRRAALKRSAYGSQESLPPSYENLLKDGTILSPEYGNMKTPLVKMDEENLKTNLEEKLNPV